MAKFMLMLFDDPADCESLSPQEMQDIVQRYAEWAEHMGHEGKLVLGEKLADEGGRMMTNRNGSIVTTDGPFAETKEVFGGFFIINADSYDEAVEIAKTCPHAECGASTHIRRIEDVPSGVDERRMT